MESTLKYRNILKDIPVKTVKIEKMLSIVLSNGNGIMGINIPYGTTSFMAKKIAEKENAKLIKFDIDAYAVNNFGGMTQIDRERYSWNCERFDEISQGLLNGQIS